VGAGGGEREKEGERDRDRKREREDASKRKDKQIHKGTSVSETRVKHPCTEHCSAKYNRRAVMMLLCIQSDIHHHRHTTITIHNNS